MNWTKCLVVCGLATLVACSELEGDDNGGDNGDNGTTCTVDGNKQCTANVVEVCTGGVWTTETDCDTVSGGAATCNAISASVVVCETTSGDPCTGGAGALQCDGSDVEICDGTDWQSFEDCSTYPGGGTCVSSPAVQCEATTPGVADDDCTFSLLSPAGSCDAGFACHTDDAVGDLFAALGASLDPLLWMPTCRAVCTVGGTDCLSTEVCLPLDVAETVGGCYPLLEGGEAECFGDDQCLDPTQDCQRLNTYDLTSLLGIPAEFDTGFCAEECLATDIDSGAGCTDMAQECLGAPRFLAQLTEQAPQVVCTEDDDCDTANSFFCDDYLGVCVEGVQIPCTMDSECDELNGFFCFETSSGGVCARQLALCGEQLPLITLITEALDAPTNGTACLVGSEGFLDGDNQKFCGLNNPSVNPAEVGCVPGAPGAPLGICAAFCEDPDGGLDLDCGAGASCVTPLPNEAWFVETELDVSDMPVLCDPTGVDPDLPCGVDYVCDLFDPAATSASCIRSLRVCQLD